MSINCTVKIIYGWRIKDIVVPYIMNDLEVWNEDYIDILDDVLTIDPMSGDYIYVGPTIANIENYYGIDHIAINEETITKAKETWDKYLTLYKDFKKIINKYIKGDSQIHVFYTIVKSWNTIRLRLE